MCQNMNKIIPWSFDNMSKSTYIKVIIPFFLVFLYFYNQKSDSPTTPDQDSPSESIADIKMQRFICDFEVFGRVQGVFFRKFTQEKAQSLNLTGWCMNTSDGTVKGQLEGAEDKIGSMKTWLQNTGSPQSSITKAVFSELKPITESQFSVFEIIRKKKS